MLAKIESEGEIPHKQSREELHKQAITSFNVQPLTIIADDEAETKHESQPIKTSERGSSMADGSINDDEAPTQRRNQVISSDEK